MTESLRFTSDNSPRAHRIVTRTAKEFAAELHEQYSLRWPAFASTWPSQNDFVRTHWHFFIEEARATLARLLSTNLREDLKEEIYDGLIRDQSLVPTRKGLTQVKLDI